MAHYYKELEVAMSKFLATGRYASPKTHSSLLAIGIMIVMFAVAVTLTTPVHAQSLNNGAPRADVAKFLGERYAEQPVSMGLAQNGGVIEVFSTTDGSTWTIVLTMPNGKSRVIGSGESWTPVIQLAGRKV